MFTNWRNCLHKVKIVIKMKTGQTGLQMANTPEMVDSVDMFILADRRVEIEDISEKLGISVGTAHKIVYDDLAFSQVSCYWVSPCQYKTLQCCMTCENHLSFRLGTATTFSLV